MSFNNIFSNNLKDRNIAITDGVFAIAMTILVLEIAVPTLADIQSGVVLTNYFTSYLAPTILIYFISFYLVYNFWETNTLLFTFKKIKHSILILNMITLATVCLIPFATGFLFEFYYYRDVNIFFSLLILIISLLYLLMFILLVRDNFKSYFEKKDKIKTALHETYDSYEDGIELDNLKIYIKGIVLTLFYILLSPIIISIISILLAFISSFLSILSFIFMIFLRFFIIRKRANKTESAHGEFNDDEKEFIMNVRQSLYGDE